jgi:signal transduction histidine kinase
VAAFVAIGLMIGSVWFLDSRRARLDSDVAREFLIIFRAAHEMSAEDLDGFVYQRTKDRPDLVIWGAQRTRYGKDLSRAGNAERITLPATIPSNWIEVDGTRDLAARQPQDFRARGRAALIKAVAGSPSIVVFVGRDLKHEAATAWFIIYTGVAVLIVVALFVLYSASLTAAFVVSRITNISRAAAGIIRGDLSQRIEVSRRNDEFDQFSKTLNLLLDRIQKLLNGVKDVSDNIAHDLRTPLYRLRSKIELALIRIEKEGAQNGPRDALELALKEADRLLGTFNALLSIARLEAGAMRDNFDEVSLVDIVRDVAELYEPVAEDRTLRLETTAEPGLIIRANRALIVQALSNLVDNALKYSPHGTRVSIGAERAVPGRLWRDAVDLFVADQGPGIAVEDRERVLERFVRLDRGHGAPGSGLGLSLVSAIARLHDAALILEDGADGIGLTARLRFASS